MSVHLSQFEELRSSVKKYRVFDFSKKIKIKQFEKGEGLETDLSDVSHTNKGELFIILEDGSIRKAVIHIVDISSWRENWGHPRFHIYNCETIKKMKEKKRTHRYKVSGKKDGKFFLIKDDRKWFEPLQICSYCLKNFNRESKNKTKQNFAIKDYIERDFSNNGFSEMQLDICNVPNRYSDCWPEISKRRKEQEKYQCEKCHIDLSKKEHRKFLHTHHVDGNKRNNTKENLEVLCIACHAEEFHHSHIKDLPQYKEFIRKKKGREF